MKAGTLDRRITLRSKSETRSATGATVVTWADVATVWAARQGLRFVEVEREAARTAQAEFKFQIRYRAGVNATMRVVEGGATYEITGVEEIGRREALYLFVRGVA